MSEYRSWRIERLKQPLNVDSVSESVYNLSIYTTTELLSHILVLSPINLEINTFGNGICIPNQPN